MNKTEEKDQTIVTEEVTAYGLYKPIRKYPIITRKQSAKKKKKKLALRLRKEASTRTAA